MLFRIEVAGLWIQIAKVEADVFPIAGIALAGVAGDRLRRHVLRQLLGESRVKHGAGVFDQPAEGLERQTCAGRQKAIFQGALDCPPGAHAGLETEPLQNFQRGLADAARRGVDDACQCDRVIRVLHQLEVTQQILDLGAVIERETAHHGVGDSVATQRFFHQPRLGVGAVEYGGAGQILFFARTAHVLLNVVGDEERFVLSVGRFVVTNPRAALARGPQVLAFALQIARYHRGGALKDHLRGAIVLLQADGLGLRKILFKLEDVADVRAAPGVNALVLIAHHAHIVFRPGEQLHQLVLWTVGVLIFVDQHVAITAVVAFPYLGGGAQQAHGLEQQVVEVERIRLAQLLAVNVIDVRDPFGHRIGGLQVDLLRIEHMVLGPGDT